MIRFTVGALLLIGLVVLSRCGPSLETVPPSPTGTVLPTPAPTVAGPSPAPATPTPTATVPPTAVPSPTLTATPTPAPTATPTPTPTATPTPTRPPLPSRPAVPVNREGKLSLGVHTEGVPYDRFASVAAFERMIGHRVEYVLWFHSWGGSDREFPTEAVALAHRAGWIPVLTWEPWERNFVNPTAPQPAYSLSSIAAGQHDEYIRSWARAARAVGGPIVLRFAHEQSTEPGVRSWYPWQGDPEGYRAAFRRIVTIFREEGATNVQFLWSAMWLDAWADLYYPGDDVVDWVGTTALNHGTGATAEWARWRSFYELFDGQYQAALKWGKPIMLTEVATAEQGGNKAEWIRECFRLLKEKYQMVRVIVLLEVTSDREWPVINWSVASSPESLAAFLEAIQDPYVR